MKAQLPDLFTDLAIAAGASWFAESAAAPYERSKWHLYRRIASSERPGFEL